MNLKSRILGGFERYQFVGDTLIEVSKHITVGRIGLVNRVKFEGSRRKCSVCGERGWIFDIEMFQSELPFGYSGLLYDKLEPMCLTHLIEKLNSFRDEVERKKEEDRLRKENDNEGAGFIPIIDGTEEEEDIALEGIDD